jgi:integrase
VEARGGIEPPIKVFAFLHVGGSLAISRIYTHVGSIRVNGRYWILKVREQVTVNGNPQHKDTYHKLGLVSEHRAEPDGGPPPSIRAEANGITAKINLGQGQGQSADSLKSYIERYLTTGRGANLRPVALLTLQSYRRDYKVIEDLIPDIQVRQVRTPHINEIFRGLLKRDGENVRATTAYRNVRIVLSGVFRAAVGEGAADFNPVREAAVVTGNDSDTHGYTLGEVKTLYDKIDNHIARAAFVVAAFTGLRKQELNGLRWQDYDQKEGVLYVQRAVNFGRTHDTKTRASKAPVPVVGIVKKALAEHLRRNSGDGFVFHAPGDSQAPVNIDHLIFDIIRPQLKTMGVKRHRMHAFRRGLNAAMTDLGVDSCVYSSGGTHHHSGYAHNRRSVAQRWIFFPLCLLALASFLFTPLIGDAATTTVQLTPGSIFFYCNLQRPPGCISSPKTATLTNTGNNILVIASITFVPANFNSYFAFSETNTCPKNLNPSGSCRITVTWHPRPYVFSTGGHVYVADNASGSPQTISVGGLFVP